MQIGVTFNYCSQANLENIKFSAKFHKNNEQKTFLFYKTNEISRHHSNTTRLKKSEFRPLLKIQSCEF